MHLTIFHHDVVLFTKIYTRWDKNFSFGYDYKIKNFSKQLWFWKIVETCVIRSYS